MLFTVAVHVFGHHHMAFFNFSYFVPPPWHSFIFPSVLQHQVELTETSHT